MSIRVELEDRREWFYTLFRRNSDRQREDCFLYPHDRYYEVNKAISYWDIRNQNKEDLNDFVGLDRTTGTFKTLDELYDKFITIIDEMNCDSEEGNKKSAKKIEKFKEKLWAFWSIPKDYSINFWSGKDIKVKIFETDVLIDLKVPLYKALFMLGTIIRDVAEKKSEFRDKFSCYQQILCRDLARQAKGDVNIYMSNDTDEIKEPFFRINNHFWNFEFPILQKLKIQGVVRSINLIFLQRDSTLSDPIEFSSKASDKLRLIPVVPVEKEHLDSSDPFDIHKLPKSKSIEYEPDIHASRFTLGKLRSIVNKWKTLSGVRG